MSIRIDKYRSGIYRLLKLGLPVSLPVFDWSVLILFSCFCMNWIHCGSIGLVQTSIKLLLYHLFCHQTYIHKTIHCNLVRVWLYINVNLSIILTIYYHMILLSLANNPKGESIDLSHDNWWALWTNIQQCGLMYDY